MKKSIISITLIFTIMISMLSQTGILVKADDNLEFSFVTNSSINFSEYIPNEVNNYAITHYEEITDCVKCFKRYFNLDENDFTDINIGEPFFIYTDDEFKQDDIFYYPIVNDNNKIILTMSIINTNHGWQYSISSEFVDKLNEIDYYNIDYIFYKTNDTIIAESKKKTSHYIFQLSDLHFGAKNVDIAERRLKSLVKSQLSKIELGDSVNFVITGDAVDSPKQTTEANYSNFAEYVEDRCGQKPIRILGNHDINSHGIAVFHGNQHIAKIVGEYPKIKIIEESKVILLLFNSNTNGNLAEGEIGIAQMSEMGNLLDNVENLESYLLIAVLHHHLLPIPKPNYYDQKWFEKILPSNFMDMSLKLLDADLFFEWLRRRNVRIVLHGHKHILFLQNQRESR